MAVLATDCPHCGTQNVAFQIVHSDRIPERLNVHICLGKCGRCFSPVCFIATHRNSQIMDQPAKCEGDVRRYFALSEIWPQIPQPSAPMHCPEPIRKRFLDGERNFAMQMWNPAAAMYRSALDIATKAMVPDAPKLMMAARLEWMLAHGKLTADLKDWADHVRIGGNDAIHDEEEFTKDDAAPLRYFTEMFFRYVYELPGEVARMRQATGTAVPAADAG